MSAANEPDPWRGPTRPAPAAYETPVGCPRHGRWAFAELTEVLAMQADFAAEVERRCAEMVEQVGRS